MRLRFGLGLVRGYSARGTGLRMMETMHTKCNVLSYETGMGRGERYG
jgi:hypothetical protein